MWHIYITQGRRHGPNGSEDDEQGTVIDTGVHRGASFGTGRIDLVEAMVSPRDIDHSQGRLEDLTGH